MSNAVNCDVATIEFLELVPLVFVFEWLATWPIGIVILFSRHVLCLGEADQQIRNRVLADNSLLLTQIDIAVFVIDVKHNFGNGQVRFTICIWGLCNKLILGVFEDCEQFESDFELFSLQLQYVC